MFMDITEAAPGVTRITLTGRLDIAGANLIDLRFTTVVSAGRAVIVDLSAVEFLASLGLRTLVLGARSITAKGGRIVALAPRPEVENVMSVSGVLPLLPVVHDLDEAIRVVRG